MKYKEIVSFILTFIVSLVCTVTLLTSTNCATLPVFNPAEGTFTKETEPVALWNIAEREAEILKALEAHGKLKVIRVKEENKWADWILGAIMVLGGLGMTGGVVWVIYNLIYLAGKYVKSGFLAIGAGIVLFGGGYMLMEYLWVLVTLLVLALAGGFVWLFWFVRDRRDEAEKVVHTIELAKLNDNTEATQNSLRSAQGKHQPFYKAIKDQLYPK